MQSVLSARTDDFEGLMLAKGLVSAQMLRQFAHPAANELSIHDLEGR